MTLILSSIGQKGGRIILRAQWANDRKLRFSIIIVISVVVSILGKGKYFKAAQLRLIQMESRDIFLKTKKKREKARKKEKIVEKRKYHVHK